MELLRTEYHSNRKQINLYCFDLDRELCSHEHSESMTPQDLQKLLDEREASRASRKRAWENLEEIRWVLKDIAGMELPPPAKKTIDLEGRLVKDGVKSALRVRQTALSELVDAIRLYRKLADKTLLTLRGSDFAHAVQELDNAIDRAEALSQ
jgi:predicted RecB family endonuclease